MKRLTLCFALLATATGAALATPVNGTTTVDFSKGLEGWDGTVNALPHAVIENSSNGTPAIHTDATLQFAQYWTGDNQAFLGNYAAFKSVTLSMDVKVDSVTQLNGDPVQRDFVVELRDYDKPGANGPYSSVWFKLGAIGDGNTAMQHFSVTFDPNANTLPAGWSGYGGQDANGNATLPTAQTFRRLLSDVDEVVFGTAVPGYFYNESQYKLWVDNIAISAGNGVSAVPETDTGIMLMAGLGMLGLLARRRQRRIA